MDGVRRRYIYAPLATTADGAFIAIGGETERVTAAVDQQIYLQLSLIALIATLSFLASWFGIHTSVLRWSRHLREAINRFGTGDLAARFGDGAHVAELAEIGLAFDRMAREICERDAGRRLAEVALRESELKFRAMFEQTFELIGLLDTEGTLLEVNDVALSFTRGPGRRARQAVLGSPLVGPRRAAAAAAVRRGAARGRRRNRALRSDASRRRGKPSCHRFKPAPDQGRIGPGDMGSARGARRHGEDSAQLELLQRHDCDEAQGYYFGRPVPPEDIARLLRE